MGYVAEWISYLQGETLGMAYSTDGWVMPLTHTDVAWMCKAVAGEAGGGLGPADDAVAWAMIQYAYARRNHTWDRRGGGWTLRPPHTLSEVLLFYCQPINPYWRNRGDAEKQERRNRFAFLTPSQCERDFPGLIRHVLDLFRGKVSGEQYTGLIEFDAAYLDESTHGDPVQVFGGNRFFYGFGSESWERGRVKVSAPGKTPWSGLLLPVAMEAAGAGVVAFGPKALAAAIALPFLPP